MHVAVAECTLRLNTCPMFCFRTIEIRYAPLYVYDSGSSASLSIRQCHFREIEPSSFALWGENASQPSEPMPQDHARDRGQDDGKDEKNNGRVPCLRARS